MKNNLKININKDDSGLNDFLSIWDNFKSRPNKVLIHSTYEFISLENYLSKYELVNKFTEIICLETEDIVNERVHLKISEDIFFSYVIIDKLGEEPTISDVVFFYREEENIKDVQQLMDEISEWMLSEKPENGHNLNVITFSPTGLDLDEIKYDDIDIENIEEYYSKQTFKDISKTLKKIKKNNYGLSILYGQRGTGKSSMIKYLANKIDRTIIFIPNNLIDLTINSPEFVKFLKGFENPLLVLDDCEMIFNEFFTKSNLISNNLLQLVDGLMANKVKLNIVAIFNVEDKNEIDHNLLDCNNLIDIIEFTELSHTEANQLSELLGYKSKHKNEIRLLDLVNNNKTSNKKRLGF